MRWSAASTFLQSRVGRRLFAAFFVLVAVLVGAVSLLAYQLTDYIVRQSASQLSSEMTKAVGINLIDRLRAAESLLRIHAQSLAAGTPPTALSERMAVVFSNVRVEASASVLPAGTGALASLRVQDGDVPDTPPAVELVVPMEPWRVHGTLNAEYLWENAQSGTHRICFSGAGFARPYCQGVQETGAAVIRSEREIFFRPYPAPVEQPDATYDLQSDALWQDGFGIVFGELLGRPGALAARPRRPPVVFYHAEFDPGRRAARREALLRAGGFGEAVRPGELLALIRSAFASSD